jgi:hypothetical protein
MHNEKIDNSRTLPNIIRMMKSRRMTWVGHVTLKGRQEIRTNLW